MDQKRPNIKRNNQLESMVYGKVPPSNIELEKVILGAILIEKSAFDIASESISAQVFYSDSHRIIFEAMQEINAKNMVVELMTVAENLHRKEQLEFIGGAYYLTQLTNSVVSTAALEQHCKIILEKFMARELIKIGASMIDRGYDESTDIFDFIDQSEQDVFSVSNSLLKKDFQNIQSIGVDVFHRIDMLRNSPASFTGVPSGFTELDRITNGWQQSDLIILAARPSVGKCLGKGTRVIMFDGTLKKVEDVRVGDLLMGDDSTPRTVLSLARGREMMYEIKQVRGVTYTVNESHIISVMASRNQALSKHGDKKDIPLLDYLSMTKKSQNNWKGYKTPIEFEEKSVEIPPYLLGIWLGDGSKSKPEISKPDIEIEQYLTIYAEKNGLRLNTLTPENRCKSHTLVSKKGKLNEGNFIDKLRNISVFKNKHIPHNYLCNSTKNRLELLAGLLDTDGYLIPTGGYEIIQKDHDLILQIKYLADTLGFRTSLNKKRAEIKSICFVGYYYRLTIFGNIWDIPVKIERKKWHKKERTRDHLIAGLTINQVGVDDYYGFVIDGNHRFLLEDCTVTHNTAFSLNLARNATNNHLKPTPIGFFSLEMSANQLVQRLLSAETEVPLEAIKTGRVSNEQYTTLLGKGLKRFDSMNMFIDDSAALNIFEFRAKARRMVSKYKVGMIIIDYLQLMSGMREKNGNREQEISQISRSLKAIAKDLNIPIIALSQLSRAVETRGGAKTPQLSDLRESGAIEQDADMVMFIYRPEYHGISSNDQGESTDGLTEIKIAKHRNGTLGTVQLRADLGIQKFFDITPEWQSNWKPIPKAATIDFSDGFNEPI